MIKVIVNVICSFCKVLAQNYFCQNCTSWNPFYRFRFDNNRILFIFGALCLSLSPLLITTHAFSWVWSHDLNFRLHCLIHLSFLDLLCLQDCIWCKSNWWQLVQRYFWNCQREYFNVMGKAWWVRVSCSWNSLLSSVYGIKINTCYHAELKYNLQRGSCITCFWIGLQSADTILWCTSCYHIPCPHEGCSTGLTLSAISSSYRTLCIHMYCFMCISYDFSLFLIFRKLIRLRFCL